MTLPFLYLLRNDRYPANEFYQRKKEIYNSLISFENNRSPGNSGLTKELYCTFWDDIKDTFMKLLK